MVINQKGKNLPFLLSLGVGGEMAVLRILNKSLKLFSLDDLGMLDNSTKAMKKLIKAPYGIILVSGPTGAGKTFVAIQAIAHSTPDERLIAALGQDLQRLIGAMSSTMNGQA